jgi:preprotein translocase subunit SecY
MIGVGVLINWFSVNYILAVDYWILMIILFVIWWVFLQINGPSAEFS